MFDHLLTGFAARPTWVAVLLRPNSKKPAIFRRGDSWSLTRDAALIRAFVVERPHPTMPDVWLDGMAEGWYAPSGPRWVRQTQEPAPAGSSVHVGPARMVPYRLDDLCARRPKRALIVEGEQDAGWLVGKMVGQDEERLKTKTRRSR